MMSTDRLDIRSIFDRADKDRNGIIDRKEFKQIIERDLKDIKSWGVATLVNKST